MSKYFKRGYYMLGAIIMIFIIYKMSLIFFNIGLESLSRQIFFLSIAMYLYVPLMRSLMIKKVPIDSVKEKQLKAGEEGERRVRKVLEELSNECKVEFGKYIGTEANHAEVDALVFSKVGVFNIEVKNWSGSIRVRENEDGEEVWLRENGSKIEIVMSPSEQVRYHREVLSKVLEEEKIIDVIVIANDKSTLIGVEKSIVPIVNYNELVDYINDYESEEEYDVNKLHESVNTIIIGDSETYKEISEEEAKNDVRWLFRSRFAVATFFFGLYIANVISM